MAETQKPSFKKWTEEDETRLLEGIQQGLSCEKIGKLLDRSTGATEIRRKILAVRMLSEGKDLNEISERTKLTPQEIEEQQEIEKRKKEKKKAPPKQDLGTTLNDIKELLQTISVKVDTITISNA